MSLLLLFQSAGGAPTPTGYGRSVDLGTFVSQYAALGQSIVYSSGLDLAPNATPEQNQTQRHTNFRIFMEACLYATGGTGAADGVGWYTDNHDSPDTVLRASGGSVFVPKPFHIEPYDTSGLSADNNYAPAFGASGVWTLPAMLNLLGNTRAPGNTTNWVDGTSLKSARIICWGSPFGWNPKGGPTPVAYSGRNLGGWRIDGIAVTRRGDTSSATTADERAVFWVGHWFPSSGTTHVNQFWSIGRLCVEMDVSMYGGVIPEQAGFVSRCGLDCEVENLQVLGNGNPGWGLIHTGAIQESPLAAGTPSTTLKFRKVSVQNTGKGVVHAGSSLFYDDLNIECTQDRLAAPYNNAHQLVIGGGCHIIKIGTLWIEQAQKPTGASGADDAVVVVGGDIGNAAPVDWSAIQVFGDIDTMTCLARNDAVNPPAHMVMIKSGRLRVGPVYGENPGCSFFALNPLSDNSANAKLEWNPVIGAAGAIRTTPTTVTGTTLSSSASLGGGGHGFTRGTGSWLSDLYFVGGWIRTYNFTTAANNGHWRVKRVTATELEVEGVGATSITTLAGGSTTSLIAAEVQDIYAAWSQNLSYYFIRPNWTQRSPYEAYASSSGIYELNPSHQGFVWTNNSATGTITYRIESPYRGLCYRFLGLATYAMRVFCPTASIDGHSSGKYIELPAYATNVAPYLELTCIQDGRFAITALRGTPTFEP